MSMSKKEEKIYISKEFAEGKIDRKLRMCEAIARILSDNYGVHVVFSPDGECSTNTERMLLPYDKGIDEALLLGLVGHETGHLRSTDFTVKRLIARNKKIYNRALLFCIVNALEDVRIERLMEEAYPGFLDLFRRMIPYIRDKKEPILRRAEKRKQMILNGKTEEEINETLEVEDEKEIKELTNALKEANFSKEYIQQEVEKTKQRQDIVLPEVQKILDLIYLILREYDYDWYPIETVEYVKNEIIDTAKKVLTCKTTHDVLLVAEEVYNLITKNDKRTKRELVKEKEEQGKKGTKPEPGKSMPGKDTPGPNEPGPKGEPGPKAQDSQKGDKSKESGKPEEQEEEIAEGKEGDENGILQLTPNKVLRVGSKVKHLEDPKRVGIVTAIDNDKQEVIVEWK
jgi:hypothetical protein